MAAASAKPAGKTAASPETTCKIAATSEPVSAVKTASVSSQDGQSQRSNQDGQHANATPAVMKATPRSSATMSTTHPCSQVSWMTLQSFQSSWTVAFEDDKAFSKRLRLASCLADPPMRSVRTADIPRSQAVEVIEVVSLSVPLHSCYLVCLGCTLYLCS